ncbi:MAG: Type I restriction modification DNA specificity domain protein [Candidatus Gottesmanbacteria bacterium GW2011_GWC2_39_8]|uniref:Type I restriction modification DNA specificity domain protein n=1 Tax=Candidatus Gottesmanbacteria bacterium GW2011_GWC2_39_8 TaxID=1618450 RepID=A0A0G0S8T3_9BACT|nr:MAG: Type I restriction modification DNA specificity domain protein [Candidatus Gottesmanbacteria bacterium GW2011_GWC2_39_8]
MNGTYQKIKFGDLYSIPSRNGLSRPESVRGSGYKMINMGELFAYDRIGDLPMELVSMSPREINDMCVEDGDLLFARQSLVLSGAGKASIIERVQGKTTFESHIIRVRLDKNKADPLFYYYYFKSAYSGMRSIVQQGVQAGIRGSDLQKLYVDYPELPDQKNIVSFVDLYDQLINTNRARLQLLEESARLLFREWFVYFRFPGHEKVKIVDGILEGWGKGLFVDIAKVRKGKNITFEQAIEGNIPVVGGGLEPTYYHDKANVSAPVITISASGANAGYVNLYNSDIWASDCSYIDKTATKYIFYIYLKLKSIQSSIFGFQVGAAQPHVYPKDLNRLKILNPPDELINNFEQIVSPIFNMVKILKYQNQKLTQARDLLLPRLMSGAIEV